jgi:NADPH-dependent curcumin reductase CurA
VPANSQIVLESRPTGPVEPRHFKLVKTNTPDPGPGQVLVRNLYLSLDPYMRGRISDAKSYAKPQELGSVMGGATVGEVVSSNNVRFKPGDKVVGMGGWQLYSVTEGDIRVVDATHIPLQAFLGPVGMPGVTAWYGLNKIIAPKKGETIVVTAATGAVGSVVGQLARFAGARTVGVAGGAEKCAYARDELGYEACIDHKSLNFAEEMRQALPQGVDGLFENVGGAPFEAVARSLNDFARIAICGLIASYDDGPAPPAADLRQILTNRIKIEGFIVSDHLSLWQPAISELAAHVAAGKIRYRETIAEGLESAPVAFIGMLKGRNFGKQLVKLA